MKLRENGMWVIYLKMIYFQENFLLIQEFSLKKLFYKNRHYNENKNIFDIEYILDYSLKKTLEASI